MNLRKYLFGVVLLFMVACATGTTYRNPDMDFGSLRTVAVLPLANLTKDLQAGDRVRDVYVTKLLASTELYVVPSGEVVRGIGLTGMANAVSPSTDEIMKFAQAVKAEGVITGVLREYGEVRSGTTSANVISLSLQLTEAQTGRVVWSASTTKGGITIMDRLFGGGGEPMDVITEKAVDELINKLYD